MQAHNMSKHIVVTSVIRVDVKDGNGTNKQDEEVPRKGYFTKDKKLLFIWALLVFLIVVLVIIFLTINVDTDPQVAKQNTRILAKAHQLVSRSDWGAAPVTERIDNLATPVHKVIIMHTATEKCEFRAECANQLRLMQTLHMESRGFYDIAYNFLIGGDGNVYEGRSWNNTGAHAKGYNSDGISVAFIGTFSSILPPEKQLNAAKAIIEEGVRLKNIAPNYHLYGLRQLVGTESPGNALFEIIKTWPNWSSSVGS